MESLTPSLGHPMPSTTSLHQRSRSGAVIILSNDERRDPDTSPIESLNLVSGGYQAPMIQEQDRQRQESGSGTEDGPRVLLVDDAAAIRNALRGVLEDAGIEVVGEAPDGTQGVAMAASLRPDVVLMDLRMPEADGFEATAQIVSELPGVRVVVLSAYESEESAEAVRAAGAFAFLPKHCGADRIRETVVAAWRSS
jgi:CheY-like chemotaxis protein